MNSSRGKVILQMSLENNAKKVRERKMRDTQNWLHERSDTEKECSSAKENQFHWSNDFVECSISTSESTLSSRGVAYIPDLTLHYRHNSFLQKTVCPRKSSSQLCQSSCHFFKNDSNISTLKTLKVAEDTIHLRKKSALPLTQNSVPDLSDGSNELHLMEDSTPMHARDDSICFPLITENFPVHFTEDSTDLHSNENSHLHLPDVTENPNNLHLSEDSSVHLPEDYHLKEDSTDLLMRQEPGSTSVPDLLLKPESGLTSVPVNENSTHQNLNDDSMQMILTKDLILEESARNFNQNLMLPLNAVGTKILSKVKRQKIATIPITEDLKTLQCFVLSDMKDTATRLQKFKLKSDWTWLAKLTMSRLILFNKRRRAEVKDLKVDDYLKRPKWNDDENGEMEMALTKTDAVLAKRMDMVIAAGKSRKNVDAYVLLPPDAQRAVEILIETRADVGVPSTNPYIFARMSTDTPLSGNAELQEVVSTCKNILHPNRITSTCLRKYIATVSQVLDMTENELEMLARHLGHDAKTHKEYYRLSHHTVELSKVSQLLLAVDSGNVNEWKGRKLSDVNTDDMELSDDDEDGDNDDDDGTLADSVKDNPASTECSMKKDVMKFDEERSEDQEKLSTSDLTVRTRTVIAPQCQADPDDTVSCSDSSSKQINRKSVTGKMVPWSATDLKILTEACRRNAAPLSFNEIRCLQALNPSLKKRSLAQIKSRA